VSALPPTELEAKFAQSAAACGMEHVADYNATMALGAPDIVSRTQFSAGYDEPEGLGRRHDAFSSFVEPLLRTPGSSKTLTVVSEVLVRRVLLQEEPSASKAGMRASGVEVETTQGSVVSVSARREVVLCAGAINSPQILQLSGIGDPVRLRAAGVMPLCNVPGVGIGLQDHVGCGIGFQYRQGVDLAPRSINSQGDLEASRSGDLQSLMYGLRKAREIVTTEPFASLIEPGSMSVPTDAHDPFWSSEKNLLRYIQASSGTSWHYSCTCRMGDLARDPEAVLDERLRVRGIAGLRVADTSVMPQVTSGNTNAPTIMIGNKAGEIILQDAVAASSKGEVEMANCAKSSVAARL